MMCTTTQNKSNFRKGFTVNNGFTVGQRVDGERYCGTPEGHRTTFVVGACDMLEFAALYVAPEHKKRFEAMLRYERAIESDELRKMFDKYMSMDNARLKFQAASCFFKALNEWCGFK
jgi:hypothetical protein